MKYRVNIKNKKIVIGSIVAALFLAGLIYTGLKNNIFADTVPASTDWSLAKGTSSSDPLKSRYVKVKINNPTPGAKFYKVTGKDVNSWIFGTEGVVNLYYLPGKGATNVGSSPFPLTLSAWNNDGVKIRDYPDILGIYYDLSYEKLNFELSVEKLDKGNFIIKASPSDAGLGAETTYYNLNIQRPTKAADGTTSFSFGEPRVTSDPELKVEFAKPGVKYISLQASSGGVYNDVPNLGLFAYGAPITIALKLEDGATPEIANTFSPNNIQISDKVIPGDLKLPLHKDNITVFSGGQLSIPLAQGYSIETSNPQYINIELPNGINLFQQAGARTKFSEISDPTIPAGYHRYRLEKTISTGIWGVSADIFQIYLTFPDSMAGTPNLKIRYKAYNAGQEARSDMWQEQGLTCETVLAVQLPKRLTTSFTWALAQNLFVNNNDSTGKNIDDFLGLYKRLGFNTVPNAGMQSTDPSTSPYAYTPEERNNALWQGMKYGPEYSLFHASHSMVGLFSALRLGYYGVTAEAFPSYADSLDFNAKFGTNLIEPKLSIEKAKWRKAIELNIASNTIDMAYDGIILQKNLEDLAEFAYKVKPEYLYLDSEGYEYSFIRWQDAVSKSENALDRKNDGESNYDLAYRMIDEFVGGFTLAVSSKSPQTKIGLYGSDIDGYAVIPNDILQRHKVFIQPEVYSIARNLVQYSKQIRENRAALPKGYELNPWITAGVYGEMKSSFVFDEIIHTFLNGGTGFSVYSFMELDDMADVLNMSKAIKLVSPYEDLIMDGDVAFGDISGTTNATVSAMKKNGQYLIGVTPKDQGKKVEFTINTSKNQDYLFIDEGTGTVESVSGQAIHISKVLAESKVYTLKVKIDSPLAPTPTSTISSPPNPSVPTTSYTFPKGFSTLGVTKSLSTSLITTVDGLYVYQFDGPNNKWLMAPTDSFTLEPSKGYYVYNKQDTKTISLPYDTFATNSYTLTKGWNMLHSTNAKQRSDIKLIQSANAPATIDSLIQQNIINPKVFIIDNDQSKDSCTYFSLLDTTDQSSNCSSGSPKKTRSIPSGKAFWVYVK